MDTPTKLGAYALGLAAVFGSAVGVGSAVGPVGTVGSVAPAVHGGQHAGSATDAGAQQPTGERPPGGLQVSQDGYTLDVPGQAPAGPDTPVSFRVLGPDGQPLTGYDTAHDEDLHLIAVRRDLTGFQHVHPERGADGTWRTPLDLTPGSWRLFADFDPAGDAAALTLGADVAVAGDHAPQPLPEPSHTAEADGYTVTLDGELLPGRESELTLSVSRDGQPVTDLQPYLGAYGHLVALRAGDLAYLHVHPAGAPGDGLTRPGPDVTFSATVPSAGDHRLFLDFRHGDVVRTAAFTVRAGGTPATAGSGSTGGHADDGHAHG
ncbi:hypothetical protein SAMN06893096_101329 [Geodermatophilus pulveris]|uniref:Heavy-metal-associated domain-containing protein n=1 Tax=Geodermatophilus pulveris TaxID=1564159 RepID=A0A239B0X2_9ACTN|nr:hypothetical protein [Geodermatophilus pulveris]SNS00904.1 hypothetical protein SAMN06893096_101329 [Geodermatophilus pulveris]